MSDDTKLADRIVALGVADRITLPEPHSGRAYQFPPGEWDGGVLFLTDEAFVTDWRVAGALMEKVRTTGGPVPDAVYKWLNLMRDIRRIPLNKNLPRAIIEACCEALEGEGDDSRSLCKHGYPNCCNQRG